MHKFLRGKGFTILPDGTLIEPRVLGLTFNRAIDYPSSGEVHVFPVSIRRIAEQQLSSKTVKDAGDTFPGANPDP